LDLQIKDSHKNKEEEKKKKKKKKKGPKRRQSTISAKVQTREWSERGGVIQGEP